MAVEAEDVGRLERVGRAVVVLEGVSGRAGGGRVILP